MDAYTNDVRNCARCGGDHDGVVFEPLTRPVARGGDREDSLLYTHWAACPTNGEPIISLARPRTPPGPPSPPKPDRHRPIG
jgi:hypothetical protein